MDGIYEILPDSIEVEVAGQKFMLAPWTLGDDAELERRILSKKRRPLEIAREFCKDQPEDIQKYILDLAFKEEVKGFRATAEDVTEFHRTSEGMIYVFWVRASKNHKNLTFADAENLFRKHDSDVVRANQMAEEMTGEGPLGNPSASSERVPMTTETQTANQQVSTPGDESTIS